MPSSAILLLERDAAAGGVIHAVLTGVGYAVDRIEDAAEAIRRAPDHSLIVIDQVEDGTSPAALCQQIRSIPKLAAIPVLCICQSDDVEERIRFLEAGADDVMAKPFDARELDARVEALLLRFQRSQELGPATVHQPSPSQRSRHLVAVFSPKGGVGTTTIAVNVAVAHSRGRPGRVVIVDFARQFGQVATHLNVNPKQTLADLTRDEQSQREPELLRSYAAAHPSGLQVLAAPGSPELAELIEARHVATILDTASVAYDAVVVDAGSTLDERSLAILERADTVVLPVCPEIAALKAIHAFLEYVNVTGDETGSISARTTFVLNHIFAKEGLKMRDVESSIGARVGSILPYDPLLYLKAVNEGIPVVIGAIQSAPATALVNLAIAAFGNTTVGGPPAVEPGRRRRLGGLLKRT